MKMTKMIALAAAAMLMTACEKQKVSLDDPLDDSMSTVTSMSAEMNNSFLVISKTDKLPNGLEKAIASANGVVENTIPEIGIAVVSSDDPGFMKKAAKIQGVQSVVPNLTVQWFDPNDKMESIDFDFGNPPVSGDDDFFFDLQWGHDAIDAPEAWELGFRGGGVRVGVLDGGFDLTHPDLFDNINVELSKDFTDEGLQWVGGSGHGSHTAGTIAGVDNGYGIIGVAPEAELVLLKVIGASGSGDFFDLMDGIVYAADADCDVINMSLGASLNKGGPYVAEFVNAVSRAVRYAHQNGTTVIASAGNDGTDYDHSANLIHLPSSVPFAISISATAPIGWATGLTDNLDVFAHYSNFGQSEIDFAAPGGDWVYPGEEGCSVAGIVRPCWVFDLVFSSTPGGWSWMAGTSMAAPHATGVAALIIEKNGGPMDPAKVKAALRASADDLGKPGNDDFYGQGRVNALRAVAN